MQYMGATLIHVQQGNPGRWRDHRNGHLVRRSGGAGSAHEYKYRFYAGRAGRTLVRYDNEAGKGDHKHVGADETEVPFRFVSMQQVVADFLADIARLTEE